MSKVKCAIWPSQLFILFLFLIFSCKFVFFLVFFLLFLSFFVFLSFLIILLLHIFLFYFLFFFLFFFFFFSVKDNIPSCDNIPAGSHGTGSCIHNLGLDITVNFISMNI